MTAPSLPLADLAAHDDGFVAHEIDPTRISRAWRDGSAVVLEQVLGWADAPPDAVQLVCVGPADDLGPLMAAVASSDTEERPRPFRVIVDVGSAALLPTSWAVPEPRTWHWMVATEPPAGAGPGTAVGDLPDVEARKLLTELAPESMVLRGRVRVERWIGSRDVVASEAQGGWAAVGALDRRVGGAGHLSGIATRGEARRRGHGEAVTRALTEAALASGPGLATLGVWTDNAPAIALYRRLGYRPRHTFSAGLVDPRP